MAMTVAISPGKFILLLCLQSIVAQQCFNNVGLKNSAVSTQQPLQKAACSLNQIAQYSGLNFNSPQQTNLHQSQQMNVQQSNIPAASQQSNLQPQLNSQPTNSQQSVNPTPNSQLQQQQNQNLASSIFSALYNIRQSSQNQGTNEPRSNPTQPTYNEQSYLPQPQNQVNPTLTTTSTINKPQNAHQPSPSVSNSFAEHSQFQPTFTVHALPYNNIPSQQNQQIFSVPVQKSCINDQNQGTFLSETLGNQQATMQSSIVSGAQTTQPLVLMLQSPQTPSAQSQTTLSTNPTTQSHPIIYTVQTAPNQNQQLVSNQPQSNNAQLDNNSLISYVMSQMQNSQGSNNLLGSLLPAMLNTKSEKSSSMKTLLPLIISMLSDKKGGCGCPHCGCNNNNQNTQAPIVNGGYSNQKTYSQRDPVEEVLPKSIEEVDTRQKPTNSVVKKNKYDDTETTNNITQNSEEEEEEEEDDDETEEEYDDE